MKVKSSFAATNSTDPVRLLHFVCTIAFPVEGVALAIINDVVVSTPVVNSMVLVGGGSMFDRDLKDLGLYIHCWCYELSGYNHPYGSRHISDSLRLISGEPSICYAISAETLIYRSKISKYRKIGINAELYAPKLNTDPLYRGIRVSSILNSALDALFNDSTI